MDDIVRGHKALSRFWSALTKTQTFEKLFRIINAQFKVHNIIVKKGIIVDFNAVDIPLRPKGKTDHRVTEDRTDVEVIVKKEYADIEDKYGTWLKKRGKYHMVLISSMLQPKKNFL